MSVRWKQARAGHEPEPRVVGPITRNDIVRYQGASGDFNPVHHDEPFATAAGFPAPLGIGMLHAGILATWATDWLGAENIRSYRVRWKRPVFPGDTLTFGGEVVKRVPETRTVDLELECTNQEGVVVCQGWASFVILDGD